MLVGLVGFMLLLSNSVHAADYGYDRASVGGRRQSLGVRASVSSRRASVGSKRASVSRRASVGTEKTLGYTRQSIGFTACTREANDVGGRTIVTCPVGRDGRKLTTYLDVAGCRGKPLFIANGRIACGSQTGRIYSAKGESPVVPDGEYLRTCVDYSYDATKKTLTAKCEAGRGERVTELYVGNCKASILNSGGALSCGGAVARASASYERQTVGATRSRASMGRRASWGGGSDDAAK